MRESEERYEIIALMRKTTGTKRVVLYLFFVASILGILWVTLFSRIGTNTRSFYVPFWSFYAILFGDTGALTDNVENIILFMPFGFCLSYLVGFNILQSTLLGILLSIGIEACQWIFGLGITEIDDLINNSLGAFLGAAIACRKLIILWFKQLTGSKRKRLILCSLIVVASISVVLIGYRQAKIREMYAIAAKNNRADGAENLLIPSTYLKQMGGSEVLVEYNDDGTIFIRVDSPGRIWKEIGRFKLPPGSYSFSGLTGVEKNTVAIELEYYDKERKKYIRLTPDVGPIEEALFSLKEETDIRALVGVYPGAKGEWIARPVIYREQQ